MTEPEAQDKSAEVDGRRGGMTLRVYRVDRYGTVTCDSGTRRVDMTGAVIPIRNAYPPCSCPHCARKRATM
jgi:hypothetical protein